MKILVELTYYRPHTSGLTIYAERLARALVNRGHSVTVLTSQYDRNLPASEIIDGVSIVRAPVLMRISKGVVMPTFGWIASKLVMEHDALSLHLPQLDAAGLALRGQIFKKPTIITYHCDLQMPPGPLSWMANQGVHLMNNLAAMTTHRIVAYTQDYAEHSPFLSRFKKKIRIIPPPVELPQISDIEKRTFKKSMHLADHGPIIGIAARFATEKGIEVLLNALGKIIQKYPRIQVWFAGPYQNILGEEGYFQRLAPIISQYEQTGHWKFLGILNPAQMAAFYPNLDVLVVPSLNSTESFGLVQIEAMMNGVPVVASDLPGVRQPVLRHRFGRIFPIGDSHAFSQAILELLDHPIKGQIDKQEIIRFYSPDSVAAEYESLVNAIKQDLD